MGNRDFSGDATKQLTGAPQLGLFGTLYPRVVHLSAVTTRNCPEKGLDPLICKLFSLIVQP